MRKVPDQSVTAEKLILVAQDHLYRIRQWEESGSYDYCFAYQQRALAVVEILEWMWVGSCGGIDCKFPVGKSGLQERLDHLKIMYGLDIK